MIVLYILGALLLLLAAVSCVRVGVYVSFGQELRVAVKFGPVTKRFLPKLEESKEKKKKRKAEDQAEKDEEKKKEKQKTNLSFADIRSAFPALLESLKRGLGKTRRRLRIYPFTLSVAFGGEDPCKVAEMYGWSCTALWTVMPQLERCVRMPDPRIHLDVDYHAAKTTAEGELGVSLLIRDGISIGCCFGIPLLKWYLSFRCAKKAQKKAAAQVKKVQSTT